MPNSTAYEIVTYYVSTCAIESTDQNNERAHCAIEEAHESREHVGRRNGNDSLLEDERQYECRCERPAEDTADAKPADALGCT